MIYTEKSLMKRMNELNKNIEFKKSLEPDDMTIRLMVNCKYELINVLILLNKINDAVNIALSAVDDTIMLCREYIEHVIKQSKIPGSGIGANFLEISVTQSFEIGTILDLEKKMIELAKVSEHGPVKKFFRHQICFHADFYRYYYLKDEIKMENALDDMYNSKRNRYDSLDGDYSVPNKQMSNALRAVFSGDSDVFNENIKKVLKWHERAAKKTYIDAKEGRTLPAMLLSRPCASAIVLAKKHGLEVNVKSEAVPEEFINLKEYLK